MPKLTLQDAATLNDIVATVNENNDALEPALENTLSRDGTSPNAMEAALDMNSNPIINLPEPAGPTNPLRLIDIDNFNNSTVNVFSFDSSTFAGLTTLPLTDDVTDFALIYDNSAGSIKKTLTGNLGFTHTSGSSVTRSIRNKMADALSIKDYGAIGDGTTNDTAAINNALAAAFTLGRAVFIPAGIYKVNESSGGSGFALLNKGVSMFGEGSNRSIIAPQSSFPNTASYIRVRPDNATDVSHLSFTDFLIYANFDGTARGKHGFHFLTDQITNIAALYMRNIHVAPSTDYSLRMENTGATNIQGVPSLCTIHNCIFYEGIYGTMIGDSVHIIDNVLKSTSGSGRIGCRIYQVDVSGTAGHLIFAGNNVVGDGGAFKIEKGRHTKVFNNNIEQNTGAGSNGAVIDIDGSSGAITNPSVYDNYVGVAGGTVTRAIRIHGTDSAYVDRNEIEGGILLSVGIDLTASAATPLVGRNKFSGTTPTTPILNNAGALTRFMATATTDQLPSSTWTTFTPTVTSGTGTITTVNGNTGAWTQIGKTVHFWAVATITTNGTGATDLRYTLPVAPRANIEFAVAGRNVTNGQTTNGRIRSGVGTLVLITKFDGTYPVVSGDTVAVTGIYEAA